MSDNEFAKDLSMQFLNDPDGRKYLKRLVKLILVYGDKIKRGGLFKKKNLIKIKIYTYRGENPPKPTYMILDEDTQAIYITSIKNIDGFNGINYSTYINGWVPELHWSRYNYFAELIILNNDIIDQTSNLFKQINNDSR